jgi:phosphatidylglycerol lysyltransferase
MMNKIIGVSQFVLKKIAKRAGLFRSQSELSGLYNTGTARTKADEQRVRILLSRYGQNPASYLSLENDKLYFFGTSVEGFIAYGIVNDVIIVLGDPVCDAADFPVLLREFKEFCLLHGFSVVFLNITPAFLRYYRNLGFAYAKSGDEARFDLNTYSLKGGRAAKIRASVNHARKFCSVLEYHPLEKRDYHIELEFQSVSDEWFEKKKTGKLVFSLGTIGFDNPLDKRYFYAVDSDGRIIGFTVFIPFITKGGNGYMADITRRRPSAPGGISELILYEAFNRFREEGIRWGSMGIAPLARVTTDNVPAADKNAAKVFNFIYEKMNTVYGFKSLFLAKREYAPTFWEPNFYAYWPRILSLHKGYAIITIQNPGGIPDYVRAFIKPQPQQTDAAQPRHLLKSATVR